MKEDIKLYKLPKEHTEKLTYFSSTDDYTNTISENKTELVDKLHFEDKKLVARFYNRK